MKSTTNDSPTFTESNYISETSLLPRHALIFYNNYSNGGTEIELIKFDVTNVEEKKFLTDADIHLIQGYFNPDIKNSVGGFRSIIPKNVLYFNKIADNIACAWISKPPKYFYFNGKKVKLKCPDLYFYSDMFHTRVFHIKRYRHEKTTLFYTFFGNNSSSDVCWGNVQFDRKKQYAEDYIATIESAFWNSQFTNLTNNKKVWNNQLLVTNEELLPLKVNLPNKRKRQKTILDDITL